MANKTKIEWANHTINPIIGCTKCSPGCYRCYAEAFARRLTSMSERYRRVCGRKCWTGDIDVDFSCFDNLPKKPSLIFVNSMGDTFHEKVTASQLMTLFSRMRDLPQHTFMLLTKRAKEMNAAIDGIEWMRRNAGLKDENSFPVWPLPNVWLGVTVCNQAEADEKMPLLLSTPAAKRFISIEPMLGEINLRWKNYFSGSPREYRQYLEIKGYIDQHESLKLLDWVICGGETGFGARPMDPDWARLIRDHCKEAGTPFFFKQMSGKAPIPEDLMVREIPQ